MKRAAMLFVVFALLLVGYPSGSTLAGAAASPNAAATGTGDSEKDGAPGGGGGTGGQNEGDADGLGGIKHRSPGLYGDGDDIRLVLRTWWKFLVWLK